MNAETRLATYGTLAPGKPNHHQLAGLKGEWIKGTVQGALVDKGWGAALGYPAIALDRQLQTVAVDMFVSDDLPAHWARLDAFEGGEYRRVVVQVKANGTELPAYIYVATEPTAGQ
jgi:gamma-glutamylcyclotransferase (GGCT)/AIG2-like uncharacterized protein YtfP